MAQWRSTAWCWTLNAPKHLDEDDQEMWLLCEADSIQQIDCKYVCYKGERVTNSHLQGFVQFTQVMNFKEVKAMFHKSIHIEKCAGTAAQNYRYCAKKKSFWRIPFWESGTFTTEVNQRNGFFERRTVEKFDPVAYWKEQEEKRFEELAIADALWDLEILHDPKSIYAKLR